MAGGPPHCNRPTTNGEWNHRSGLERLEQPGRQSTFDKDLSFLDFHDESKP